MPALDLDPTPAPLITRTPESVHRYTWNDAPAPNPTLAGYEVTNDVESMPAGWQDMARKSGEVALFLHNAHGTLWAGLYSARGGGHYAHLAGRAFVRGVQAGQSPADYLESRVVRAVES